jgi:hypothetical protein
MSETCKTCEYATPFSGDGYAGLICRRFPPSIGDGESRWDEFAPAKFPIVYENWRCGEWVATSEIEATPETVSRGPK